MKFKNIIAASVLTFVFIVSCKPTTTPTSTTSGGSGGSGGGSTSSVTSTSSGPVETGPCVKGCPEVLPNTGDSCDALADQYCEYAGSICKAANCNSSTAIWEVSDLNPCACYPGPSASKMTPAK